MHLSSSFISLWLVFASYVIAANTPLLYPSQDDFYKPPANLLDYAPGDVIRIRPAPAPLRSIYFPVNVKKATQILVRSNDAKGAPTAAVSTVIEPYNADPKKLLSYLIAQDSSLFDCSPSYALLYGASMTTFSSLAEMFLIQLALEEGWYVVSTDHQGQNAAYTVGRQGGKIVLDGIRGTLQSRELTGIDEDPKIAFWGYSGGTVAAGWAAALQPTYAPELKEYLIGAAMGGFVTNITKTAIGIDGSIFSGLALAAIAGISDQYPEVKPLIEDQIISPRKVAFQEAYNLCMIPALVYFNSKTFFSGPAKWFKSGWETLTNPQVQLIIRANTLGINETEVPEIPILVYHGSIDTIVPIEGAHEVYDAWCSAGIESFEFAEDESAGHVTEIVAGSLAGFKWLKDRFNGIEPIKGCNHTVRTTNLEYPGTISGFMDFLGTSVKTLLDEALGPNAENLSGNSTTSLLDSIGSSFSDLSDFGSMITSILYKRDQASMDAFDFKVKNFKRSI